jgi:Uma2 family endonuclease
MTQAVRIDSSDRITGQVLLPNVPWQTYLSLLDGVGDHPIRLTYDRGMLEIEVPSLHHERLKKFAAQLVETCLVEMGIDYEPAGSATWRLEQELRGLEPDECYYIQNAAQVRGKTELDLQTDPPPDLAIEIDVTSSSLDKLELYKTMRVPEIWRRLPNGRLEIHVRRPDGSYEQSSASVALPLITSDILNRYFALRDTEGHAAALREFRSQVLHKG